MSCMFDHQVTHHQFAQIRQHSPASSQTRCFLDQISPTAGPIWSIQAPESPRWPYDSNGTV